MKPRDGANFDGRNAAGSSAGLLAWMAHGACVLATLSIAWGAAGPAGLDDQAGTTEWVNTEGVAVVASFVRLGEEGLVIRKDGREFTVPLYKLSPESKAKARELAEEPQAAPPTVDPTAVETGPEFGRQTDPDHERKLAEAVIAKGGWVQVWQDESSKEVRKREGLPKGTIRLKFIETKEGTFGDEEAALLNGCKDLLEIRLWGARCRALPLGSLPRLRIFRMSGDVPASVFPVLPRLKHLTGLHVLRPTIPLGDEIILPIAECDGLNHVELVGIGLKSPQLAPLARLKALKTLAIGENAFEPAALAPLGGAEALESLGLDGVNATGVDLAFLVEMDSLRRLSLDGATLTREAVASVAACRNLKVLNLTRAKVTDDMLAPLAGHRGLREIHLLWSRASGREIFSGEPLPALGTLVLGESPLTDDDVGMLATACPNLRSLIARGRGLTRKAYPSLASLRDLRVLEIKGGTEIDSEVLGLLAGLPRLEELRLWRSDIDDADLPGLEKARRSLLQLDLRGTKVTDASIEFLRGFKLLNHLLISGARVSEEGIKTLKAELDGCRVE